MRPAARISTSTYAFTRNPLMRCTRMGGYPCLYVASNSSSLFTLERGARRGACLTTNKSQKPAHSKHATVASSHKMNHFFLHAAAFE
ncbi:hypothetical protein EON66_02190 [archaeon]|nr:MAG: hypothetical protein EON66_02190 [archaeon]